MKRPRIDWIGVGAVALMLVVLVVWGWWLLVAEADAHPGVSAKAARIYRVTNMPGCHTWACVARDPWRRRWVATPDQWRGWARATEACESGHDPRAYSAAGPYYGALQFDAGTWVEAGGSGVASDHSIFEQRVRAVWLARRVGTSRWPVCG